MARLKAHKIVSLTSEWLRQDWEPASYLPTQCFSHYTVWPDTENQHPVWPHIASYSKDSSKREPVPATQWIHSRVNPFQGKSPCVNQCVFTGLYLASPKVSRGQAGSMCVCQGVCCVHTGRGTNIGSSCGGVPHSRVTGPWGTGTPAPQHHMPNVWWFLTLSPQKREVLALSLL